MSTAPSTNDDTHTGKLLTLSIAAYNVAPYISQTLESCITERIGDLDIIVVSDGSTDATEELARSFARRHPDSIRVLPKPNGGYGSTVNAALSLARGRYFKLLDGDDWVSPDGLDNLLALLEASPADLVLTPFVFDNGRERTVRDDAEHLAAGHHDFATCGLSTRVSMHSLAIRTSLLRESQLALPEHCLYTDTLFVTLPLPYVRTVEISHTPVYQYRVGRDGQSMERRGLLAHQGDLAKVTSLLAEAHATAPRTPAADAIATAWLVNNGVLLYNLRYASPCTRAIGGERRKIDAILDAAKIREAVLARSRTARAFARLPSWALCPATYAYRAILALKRAAATLGHRQGHGS